MRSQPARRDLVALQEFEWRVAAEGYEWVADAGATGQPGVAQKPGVKDVDIAAVLVDLGLFNDFAQLRPNKGEILEFVYWHGLLGLSPDNAESLAQWRRHIGLMKRAIGLARAGDRARAAKIANEQLAEHTDYQLVAEKESGLLRPRCVPRNLLGAMWVQFANAVDTDAGYAECAVCSRTMLIAPWLPGGRRSQRKYCSNACNQKSKRMRAKAREMLAIGSSRRRVAAELGVEASWLRDQGL